MNTLLLQSRFDPLSFDLFIEPLKSHSHFGFFLLHLLQLKEILYNLLPLHPLFLMPESHHSIRAHDCLIL